jgi:hypothetical protein
MKKVNKKQYRVVGTVHGEAKEKFIMAKTSKSAKSEFKRMYPNATKIVSMLW